MNSRETPSKIAVLGSGPLPLTSLCIVKALARNGARTIHIQNIDRDSCELCRKLGHSKIYMDFRCADIKSGTIDLYDFDVVYLAALVDFNDEEKDKTIATITKRMRPETLLVLRRLMYPVNFCSWYFAASHCECADT